MEEFWKSESVQPIVRMAEGEALTVKIDALQRGTLFLDWHRFSDVDAVVDIAEDAQVEIVETGEGRNLKINYILGRNSKVQIHYFTKDVSGDSTYSYALSEAAELEVAYADFSSGKKHLHARVNLEGAHAAVRWHLAALSRQDDFKQYEINFQHTVGETFARMETYGVCKDRSTLNFLGDAVIAHGAKKASTGQTAKIMVFDRDCHAKASPKLCIYENDVEASHGASEGQINQDHIFYLTSRGLSEDEAKRLITLGYLYPILRFFSDETLREEIENCIVKRV